MKNNDFSKENLYDVLKDWDIWTKFTNKPIFQPITIVLNKEYKAEVREDRVICGCQEFTLEKIEELAAAVKKAREFKK